MCREAPVGQVERPPLNEGRIEGYVHCGPLGLIFRGLLPTFHMSENMSASADLTKSLQERRIHQSSDDDANKNIHISNTPHVVRFE
jgi:hypothetical protein